MGVHLQAFGRRQRTVLVVAKMVDEALTRQFGHREALDAGAQHP